MHWKDFLNDFVCPKCKGPLTLTPKGDGLKCSACKRIYPVRDDIPILLEDQATIEG